MKLFKDFILNEEYTAEMKSVFSQNALKNAGYILSKRFGIGVQNTQFKEITPKEAMKRLDSMKGKALLVKAKTESYLIFIYIDKTTNTYELDSRSRFNRVSLSRKEIVNRSERIFITDVPDDISQLKIDRYDAKTPNEQDPLYKRLALYKVKNKSVLAFPDSKTYSEDAEKVREKVAKNIYNFIISKDTQDKIFYSTSKIIDFIKEVIYRLRAISPKYAEELDSGRASTLAIDSYLEAIKKFKEYNLL